MGTADSHVNAEVRAVLAPLAELAAQKRVAILAVTHLRKGEGAAMYRAMGSLAFVAAARAAWAVVRDKHDPQRRLMVAIKNNLAADTANGVAFTIEPRGPDGAPVVCWEPDPVTITADEAMSPEPKRRGPAAECREEAANWIRGALADGPRLASEVAEEAVEGQGLAKRTLDRARQEIGVVAFRPQNPGPWWWRLPDGSGCHNGQSASPTQITWQSGNLPESPKDCSDCYGHDATSPSFQATGLETTGNVRPGHLRGLSAGRISSAAAMHTAPLGSSMDHFETERPDRITSQKIPHGTLDER
jgi:hypothetical protein